MKSIVLLVVFVALAAALTDRENFNAFKSRFGKSYPTTAEHEKRFQIFQDNMRRAEAQNARGSKATYGVTKFSDLTPQEFKNTYLMKNVTFGKYKTPDRLAKIPKVNQLPSSFDWSSKGMVTPVKNQGQCGSCWDFSVTETMESVWAIAGNALTTLSEQQVLDCDTTDGGCNGGDPTTAYQYLISAGGQESESDYPYTAEQGSCNFNNADIVAQITSWNYVTQSQDENQMQQFVYSSSPMSVCVDAETWQSYTGGVIDGSSNCGNSLDHCVQITGFQQMNDQNSGSNVAVWNVRNSWDTDWGVNGYIYVEIGGNYCGIATEVTVPVA